MTVGELKEELKDIDDSLHVLVYCSESEDANRCYGVKVYENTLKSFENENFGEGLPYVKGDYPEIENGDKIVFLG